jgi:hypothetical protein
VRKTIGILTVLAVALLCAGAEEASAAYAFVPQSISLRDEKGNKVTSLYMEATQTVELYVEMDDYLLDGDPTNDYVLFELEDGSITVTLDIPNATVLQGTSTIPTLLGLTPDLPTMLIPPRTIARVRLTARNTGGTESSTYQPVYTDFVYRFTFAGMSSWPIETSRVSVVILALDDATGTLDDAGGTCNFLRLGALTLLVPVALIRRKK